MNADSKKFDSKKTVGKNNGSRIHGLDALRAMAIVLVVVLHAGVPYLAHRMPGLLWSTFDSHSSAGVDACFWWIECFIMALYFTIAGFFAAQLLHSKGTGGFLKNRTKRLFLPLVVASLTILPITGFLWVYGWVLDGKVSAIKLQSFKFEAAVANDFWGYAHLWFLQYLCIYCLGYWAIAKFAGRENHEEIIDSKQRSWWVAVVISFPICLAAMWFDPQIVVGFQQSIPPMLPRMIYYGVFFATGTYFFRQRDWIGATQRGYIWLLGSATICFAAALPFIQSHIRSDLVEHRFAVALGVTVFAWLMTLGLLGAFLRHFSKRSESARYLADASFWIYLVHLPIVGAVHLLLARAPIEPGTKFVVASIVTLAISLTTYQLFVRHTRLGIWLEGGHSKPPRVREAVEPRRRAA